MRYIDPELQASLDGGATHLCRCWRVKCRDGTVFGFTDHDEDVLFEDVSHRAGSGLDASALESSTGLSVDNVQAVGALSDSSILDEDIQAGKFDDAEVNQWLVDWKNPNLRIHMFSGTFGAITRSDGKFEVELRGLEEKLNVPLGRIITSKCDRRLGDQKCGFNLDAPGFAGEGVVTSEGRTSTLKCTGLADFDDAWFTHGVFRWLTGANAGTSGAVKADRKSSDGSHSIVLWQQPARAVQPGDTFRVIAGCDKASSTCREKFSNFLNFRGFPHIPGEDWVTAYPKNGAIHDGGSRQ